MSGASILGLDPDVIRSDFNKVSKAIKAGYDIRSDQDQLFSDYVQSTRPVKSTDSIELRLKAIRAHMKNYFDVGLSFGRPPKSHNKSSISSPFSGSIGYIYAFRCKVDGHPSLEKTLKSSES
jgi:hypothetical protein